MSNNKSSSFFEVNITLTDKDLEELFGVYDPLRVHSDKEYKDELTRRGTYDPIDFPYLCAIRDDFLNAYVDHYFRAEIFGVEHIKDEGPAIIGCNHSGTAFPHDALVLDALIWRHNKFKKQLKCRSVYSPKLAKVWWMRPFGIDDFWRRGGAVDMTFVNFDTLLTNGERVIYYPEGVTGIGKGFSRRYQLQHFYSSFVVLSSRHNAPFYPVLCVNAEWVNPTSITIKWVDSIFDKLLGLPFFPIPAAIIGLIFPFFFYLSFPCNMKFVVLEPVNIRKMLEEEGCTDFMRPDKTSIHAVAEKVKRLMQIELDKAVEEHGKKPYNWVSLRRAFKELKEKGLSRFLATPLGWPIQFLSHERNLRRKPAKNRLFALLRDWDLIFFYIPFGWLFLALTRTLRKPPNGYRGLSKNEKKFQTGSYFWSLEKHPMPKREERFL